MQGSSQAQQGATVEAGDRATGSPAILVAGDEVVRAVEAERRRIAALLHDDVGQTLTLAMMRLEQVMAPTHTDAPAALQDVRVALETSLATLRSLTVQIVCPVLYEQGLPAALTWLGTQILAPGGIRVEEHLDESITPAPPIGGERSLVIYHTVREAYVNILKHARAKLVILRGGVQNSSLEIVVEDDGVGLDAERWAAGTGSHVGEGYLGGDHFGLFNLRLQLRLIGGRLTVDSTPGKLTRLHVIVPLEPAGGIGAPARPQRELQ